MDIAHVAVLRQRVSQGKATADDLRNLSNAYLADNDLANAYPYLDILARLQADSPQSSIAAGLVALTLAREDEAEKHFVRAVEVAPEDYDANHNLGLLSLLRGNLDKAREVFERLSRLFPDRATIYHDLAVVWGRIGNPNQVLSALEKALELDPGYEQARLQAESYAAQLGVIGGAPGQRKDAGGSDRVERPGPNERRRWLKLTGRNDATGQVSGAQGQVTVRQATEPNRLVGRKLLFVASQKSFLTDIINELSRDNQVEVYGGTKVDEMMALMRGADVAWFEWCDNYLIEATRLPKMCPIICRLHSYEAFTDMPRKVDWSKVDHLVFVNESVQTLFKAQVSEAPPMSVIHNGVDLARFRIPKRKQYGKKIASIGYINYKKNPALLLYCFKKIHEYDPEYTLHIAGKHQDSRIALYFEHFLRCNPLPVEFEGWVQDIPSWLADKSYVISTSLFESFHYSIAEGMASGVMPLIHNWYGADGLYPNEYLFEDPDGCLELLRRLEQEDKRQLAHCNRRFIGQRYDVYQKTEDIARLMASVVEAGAVAPSAKRGS
jgi:tetratricopeptide (TPR) repeat protein